MPVEKPAETRQQRRARDRHATKTRTRPPQGSGRPGDQGPQTGGHRLTPKLLANAGAGLCCLAGAGLIMFTETVTPALAGLVLFAAAGGLVIYGLRRRD